jgi:ribosome-associated toxin RatA of RatAB toxin-antitoxin module
MGKIPFLRRRAYHPRMPTATLLTGWTLALLALASGMGPAGAAGEQARLERGEVVVSTAPSPAGPGQPRGVQAAILLDAPVATVWDVMVDCPRAPEFVPGMRECRVLEHAADHETIRHRVKVSALLPEVTYVFRADYRKHETIDFVRTGGDLKEMEGHWTLTALDGGRRTLVRYSVYLDPGFLVPQWAVRRSLRHDLPELLRALRRRVAGQLR